VVYAGTALVLLAGLIAGFLLQIEKNQLQAEVERLRTQGNETAALSAYVNDIDKAWAQARQYRPYVGDFLAGIEYLLPLGVEVSNLEYKEGNLTLQGTTTQAEDIAKLLNILKDKELKQPMLTTYQQTEQAVLKFVIKTGTN
jgi:Tfp pilus assembly protein PilN